ncbi:MAG: DNA/RNA non-specific endonuclease [Faecalibacterium sp.]|nr:DNA/RNA non-specific endonuclease [Faecalibacterium sp.]
MAFGMAMEALAEAVKEGTAKAVAKGVERSVIKTVEKTLDGMTDALTKKFGELPEQIVEKTATEEFPEQLTEVFESNSSFEIDDISYETDDNGHVFKIDGELQPESQYKVNGIEYQTDESGEILSWKGEPSYHPENERDIGAQMDAGGDDRLEGDDGGHLEARILGGASGKENLVAMRSTINRGDWKRAENEIVEASKRGEKIEDRGTIQREGENSRPTKIERDYSYGHIHKNLRIDNVEGSRDLLEGLQDALLPEDHQSLLDEVNDMVEDGNTVSVTSVSKSYDADGLLKSICVGLRNETIGEKMYRTFDISSTEKQEG